jgi:hypothetical protein
MSALINGRERIPVQHVEKDILQSTEREKDRQRTIDRERSLEIYQQLLRISI